MIADFAADRAPVVGVSQLSAGYRLRLVWRLCEEACVEMPISDRSAPTSPFLDGGRGMSLHFASCRRAELGLIHREVTGR